MASTAVFASVALVASPTPATSLEGHWLHPEKSVIIRLSPCGSNLCGTVTWANASAQKAAHRGIDKLVGAELLTGFKPNRNGQWKGNIFIPDLNMHVGGKIQTLDARRLNVSGCILGGMICRSQTWTRSDEAVPSGG